MRVRREREKSTTACVQQPNTTFHFESQQFFLFSAFSASNSNGDKKSDAATIRIEITFIKIMSDSQTAHHGARKTTRQREKTENEMKIVLRRGKKLI